MRLYAMRLIAMPREADSRRAEAVERPLSARHRLGTRVLARSHGRRPMKPTKRLTDEASGGTSTIAPKALPSPRYCAGSVASALTRTSLASLSVKGIFGPVALARSHPWAMYSISVMLKTIWPGSSPVTRRTGRSRPFSRHPVESFCAASTNSRLESSPALYALRVPVERLSARRPREDVHPANDVIYELTHAVVGTRSLAFQLIRPNARDDPAGLG